jgi:hypothetical protein
MDKSELLSAVAVRISNYGFGRSNRASAPKAQAPSESFFGWFCRTEPNLESADLGSLWYARG